MPSRVGDTLIYVPTIPPSLQASKRLGLGALEVGCGCTGISQANLKNSVGLGAKGDPEPKSGGKQSSIYLLDG